MCSSWCPIVFIASVLTIPFAVLTSFHGDTIADVATGIYVAVFVSYVIVVIMDYCSTRSFKHLCADLLLFIIQCLLVAFGIVLSFMNKANVRWKCHSSSSHHNGSDAYGGTYGGGRGDGDDDDGGDEGGDGGGESGGGGGDSGGGAGGGGEYVLPNDDNQTTSTMFPLMNSTISTRKNVDMFHGFCGVDAIVFWIVLVILISRFVWSKVK
uniref:Uncharacterized protein n=1 Tax=Panagrolaimus sp. JU765 TaxID=591449 RepID=A0AC34RT64_9BILA